jgi:uncharacterized Fe-S center protein
MSDVFFTNLRIEGNYSLLDKLERLVKAAGMMDLELDKKFTAIKIHFGEPGNLAYLRPNWAARIVKLLKEKGAKPFLTDCNTLYKGRRANALDHLESAFENGYYPGAVGCPVLIADGLKGLEYRDVEINQKNCKTAKIGSAIADADVFVSMNHFKGHEMTGFGGALKNIGMGSGSIGGKLEMHSASKPHIVTEKCTGCKVCEKNCNHDAVHVTDKIAVIDYGKCVGCGQCVAVCNFDAASVNWDEAGVTASEKIAEYTMAVLKDKSHFHVNFVMNVSPNCDCWNLNDQAIVPDIGIFASADPVALDQACVDKVNSSVPNPGSVVESLKPGDDKFTKIFENTNWDKGLEYAERIGLGKRKYTLKEVK